MMQLRSLEFHVRLKVDVPIVPFLLMPGLTSLETSWGSNEEGSLCWDSPLMSVEDMRRRHANRPAALRRLCLNAEDSDAEALAGLSALTRMELHGPMELTRPHRLPKLKHLVFDCEAIQLLQLDLLIGGSTSLCKIAYEEEGQEFPDRLWLGISAMRNNSHGITTALRSVSLALHQCCMSELSLYSRCGSGRLRLVPGVIEALAPLAETLKKLSLFRLVVDEGAIRSIAQHLTHLRALDVNRCTVVEGSRAALHKANIELEGTDEEENEEDNSEEEED
eukprot:gene10058-7954_t